MSTERRRLALVAGSTLALVLAGAGIVSAQSASPAPTTTTPSRQTVPLKGDDGWSNDGWSNGRGDQRGHGGRDGGRGGRGDRGDRGGFGQGPQGDPRGGRGWGDGEMVQGLGRAIDGLVSQEVVRLDADGNVLTSRLQHGTVTANADGSLTITLATGEAATVTTDATTQAFDWSTTTRPMRSEIAVSAVAAGADVIVWSQSQADGSFLAQRIAVLPAATPAAPAASPSPAAVG